VKVERQRSNVLYCVSISVRMVSKLAVELDDKVPRQSQAELTQTQKVIIRANAKQKTM